jgi:hypothetical protein
MGSLYIYIIRKPTNIKAKVVLVHVLEAHRGRRDTAPFTLNLGTRFDEWLTSRSGNFSPGKEPRYPLNSKVGGP